MLLGDIESHEDDTNFHIDRRPLIYVSDTFSEHLLEITIIRVIWLVGTPFHELSQKCHGVLSE